MANGAHATRLAVGFNTKFFNTKFSTQNFQHNFQQGTAGERPITARPENPLRDKALILKSPVFSCWTLPVLTSLALFICPFFVSPGPRQSYTPVQKKKEHGPCRGPPYLSRDIFAAHDASSMWPPPAMHPRRVWSAGLLAALSSQRWTGTRAGASLELYLLRRRYAKDTFSSPQPGESLSLFSLPLFRSLSPPASLVMAGNKAQKYVGSFDRYTDSFERGGWAPGERPNSGESAGGTFGGVTVFHTTTYQQLLHCNPSKVHSFKKEGKEGRYRGKGGRMDPSKVQVQWNILKPAVHMQ